MISSIYSIQVKYWVWVTHLELWCIISLCTWHQVVTLKTHTKHQLMVNPSIPSVKIHRLFSKGALTLKLEETLTVIYIFEALVLDDQILKVAQSKGYHLHLLVWHKDYHVLVSRHCPETPAGRELHH